MPGSPSIPNVADFATRINGSNTAGYILKNDHGMAAFFTNYGARWVSMLVPDKDGQLTDVINGFDTIQGYLDATETYYGATVGRYANRIAKGKFVLNETSYKLAINNPPNHLHGGVEAFHKKIWNVTAADDSQVTFSYVSHAGEEGYPGELTVTVRYTLTRDNTLDIYFHAISDADTVINLTNHAYFNLNGQGNGSILDHSLQINADGYTPIDSSSIPLGYVEPVANTPFDFRTPTPIGDRIGADHEQLQHGNGYDHNFVLNQGGDLAIPAAEATGDLSGIKLTVYTTEPGVQLYTGNFLNNENVIKQGKRDGKRAAFCLETQHFPDSPNQPAFPSTTLLAGDTFVSRTRFAFSV